MIKSFDLRQNFLPITLPLHYCSWCRCSILSDPTRPQWAELV